MPDPYYRSLVWLDVRLGVLFAVGVPLVLLVWSFARRQPALIRLMGLYWKVSSLFLIALLLLVDRRPSGYLLLLLAPLLILATLWFWVDLNEELADMPPWRPLPLTVRIWRWSLSLLSLFSAALAFTALPCMPSKSAAGHCQAWLEAPRGLNNAVDKVFDFVFGADWNPGVAAFFGYLALVAYVVGFLQWLLVRLPRHGRVAGEF